MTQAYQRDTFLWVAGKSKSFKEFDELLEFLNKQIYNFNFTCWLPSPVLSQGLIPTHPTPIPDSQDPSWDPLTSQQNNTTGKGSQQEPVSTHQDHPQQANASHGQAGADAWPSAALAADGPFTSWQGAGCSCCSQRLHHITGQVHILSSGYLSGPQQGYHVWRQDWAGPHLQSSVVAAPRAQDDAHSARCEAHTARREAVVGRT